MSEVLIFSGKYMTGSEEDISIAEQELHEASRAYILAKLRLRVLHDEPIIQVGDKLVTSLI